MPFLALSKICKAFSGAPVADCVDLDIGRGEFFSLLGPSGCGKTTLLRMIAGLEVPDSGAIFIEGQDVTRMAPWQRPTNMVFQTYAIFPHLNVFDNVAYGLRKRGLSKLELRSEVENMLATVQLEGFSGRGADQLSGGQRQRVALARALICKPKILLLDEPLAALDKRLREAMQFELRSLQRRIAITFLLVTHDEEEALSLSDRIAVMSRGKILQIATPRELYERPNCREVADFIGEINFFYASIRDISPNSVTVNAGLLGNLELPRSNIQCTVKDGDRIVLAIRPENLRFAAKGIRGEIVASTFRGERSHFHVMIAGRSTPIAVSTDTPACEKEVHLELPPEFLIGLPYSD